MAVVNALPPNIQEDAKKALDILVNHLMPRRDRQRLAEAYATLRIIHDPQDTCYDSLTNSIKIAPYQYGDIDAYFEEAAHFIRAQTNPSPKMPRDIHAMAADEFFGYLGRYVGKELAAGTTLEPAILPLEEEFSFMVDEIERLLFLHNQKEREEALYANVSRIHLLLKDICQTMRNDGDAQAAIGKIDLLEESLMAYRGIGEETDSIIDDCCNGLTEYREVMPSYHEVLAHATLLSNKKRQTEGVMLKLDTVVRMLAYKAYRKGNVSMISLSGFLADLEAKQTLLASHIIGYGGVEEFLAHKKDFMKPAKILFFKPDERTYTFMAGPRVLELHDRYDYLLIPDKRMKRP